MPREVPDIARRQNAIHNAFKVACLSIHGKPLQAVSTHYQDIMDLPSSIDDPHVYYDKLESSRIRHNGAQGISAIQHKPHQKSLEDFYRYYSAHHPNLSPSQAREAADRQAHIFQYEIEDKLQREKPDKPIDEQQVFKILDRKLKNFLKPHKEASEPKSFDNPNAYHGFHAHSCFGMANASKHLDNLLKYAHEDVAKGGKGHHFREQVLNDNIKHLGPREIGLAWYLLSPNRSELVYIDHTILDALGYKPKDYNHRDYPKFERELAAGRDASGYNHVPLGQFQKGLLDQYQGPISFETLAVHDPVRVRHVNWQPQPAPHVWPEWWNDTKSYRDDVAKEWNKSVGKYNPPQTVMATILESNTLKASEPSRPLYYLYINIPDDSKGYSTGHTTITRLVEKTGMASLAGAPIQLISNGTSLKTNIGGESIEWSYAFPRNEQRVYYTRLHVPNDSLLKLATVGPDIDNSVNDPLANLTTESMPSWEWQTQKECDLCHGDEIIMQNGRLTACPQCSSWTEKQIFDNGESNNGSEPDPAWDNPSGIRSESPGSIGP